MYIVLHKKYISVPNVTINIIKIKYHQNIKEKSLKMTLFWTLDIVIIIKQIKINFFVKFVTYQCV